MLTRYACFSILFTLCGNAIAEPTVDFPVSTPPRATETALNTAERPAGTSVEAEDNSVWAWLLIGASVAAGATLLGYGVTRSCHGDRRCRIDTSLMIWGGMGVASAGSLLGFTLLAEETPESASIDTTSPPLLVFSGQF